MNLLSKFVIIIIPNGICDCRSSTKKKDKRNNNEKIKLLEMCRDSSTVGNHVMDTMKMKQKNNLNIY